MAEKTSVRDAKGATDGNTLTIKMARSSKAGHSMTDAAVNTRLIGLFADPKIYAGAIGCFYLIFETLEREMEREALSDERKFRVKKSDLLTVFIGSAAHQELNFLFLILYPGLARFLKSDRPLFRTAQFQQDMLFYFGPEWRKELETRSRFPAVDRYLDQLKQLAKTQPILLAAHAYTQHSAVASGGQIISKLVRKGLQLQDQSGTAAFEYLKPPRELKLTLKHAVDSLEGDLSNEEVQALILQHQAVFIYNNEIIKGYRVGFLAPAIASIKLLSRNRAVKVVLIAGITLGVALYVRK
jgi:heme oxygenase